MPEEHEKPIKPQVTVPLAKSSGNVVPVQGTPPKSSAANFSSARREESFEQNERISEDLPAPEEQESYEDIYIGKQKIQLAIPSHIIRQAQLATPENKNKLAGYWSAQILKGNPNIMHSSMSDPVAVWFEVKNIILKKFNSSANKNSAMTSL